MVFLWFGHLKYSGNPPEIRTQFCSQNTSEAVLLQCYDHDMMSQCLRYNQIMLGELLKVYRWILVWINLIAYKLNYHMILGKL